MAGTINWKVTCESSGPIPILELYEASDPGADPVETKPCPCSPCIACPWPMQNLDYGDYKAAIRVGSDRYFYIEGVDPLTAPNSFSDGTTVTISSAHPEDLVKIRVVL